MLSAGWFAIPLGPATGGALGSASSFGDAAGSAFGQMLMGPPGTVPSTSASGTGTGASIAVAAFSSAQSIPASFWGINVAAAQQFKSTDASAIGQTPVTYVRFPGGYLGEEYNYTSGIITSDSGSHSAATTSVKQFVATCQLMHCQAILQLPAEINQPATAAYYAKYVVQTLGFQPAFWEIGNSPSGWHHYNIPWSKWASGQRANITPLPFASLVQKYMTAVHAVDPGAKFVALGAGMGPLNYDESWIDSLMKVVGKNLAGISVHSYIMGGGPSNPTDQELFANLQGKYSLPKQAGADMAYIKKACSTCATQLFVSEINAAELSTYDKLLTTFAGTVYLAAETVQGLEYRVPNLDWFCYLCSFQGAWSQSPGKWQMQYYLFSDVLKHLEKAYLPSTVTGPSTFYAAATYSTSGIALLMVNVNTTHSISVSVGSAGIPIGHAVTQYLWKSGSLQPTQSSTSMTSTVTLAPESILLLVS